MNFGMKLQQLRKQKGLSQEALAEYLNVSRQAVGKWETSAGYPEMDKLILLSELFDVSLDYLLKDTKDIDAETTDTGLSEYFMNTQKIQDYMRHKEKAALGIAGCILLIIESLLFPILLSDTKQDTLGSFLFLVAVGLAVFGLIVIGIHSEKYQSIEKNPIVMSFHDLQEITIQYEQFKSRFAIAIGAGVALIILSLAAVVFLESANQNTNYGGALFISVVGLAVFIFIYQGLKDAMYRFLVRNKEFVTQRQNDEDKDGWFGLTMPLAAMLYLIMGFTKGWWHPGWIIFPITAILTEAFVRLKK